MYPEKNICLAIKNAQKSYLHIKLKMTIFVVINELYSPHSGAQSVNCNFTRYVNERVFSSPTYLHLMVDSVVYFHLYWTFLHDFSFSKCLIKFELHFWKGYL